MTTKTNSFYNNNVNNSNMNMNNSNLNENISNASLLNNTFKKQNDTFLVILLGII